MLRDLIQHPLTILPASAGALAALWTGLIGASQQSVGMTIAALGIAAGAFVVNYFFRGPNFAAKHVAELRTRRDRHRMGAARDLERACAESGFAEGAKEAAELNEAFLRLRDFLDGEMSAENADDPAARRFLALAEDSHREGLGLLRTSLAAHQAVAAVDIGKHRSELAAWEAEASRASAPPAADMRREALARNIASHRRRIQTHNEQRGAIERLLAESNEIEAALESACLQLAERQARDAQEIFGDDGASARLEGAIAAARRVERRLRGADALEMERDLIEGEIESRDGFIRD